MSSPYKGATCKGSFMLGTACGRCERCEDERKHLGGTLQVTPGKCLGGNDDTDGDGNCGKPTCAACYPQNQPVRPKLGVPKVFTSDTYACWSPSSGKWLGRIGRDDPVTQTEPSEIPNGLEWIFELPAMQTAAEYNRRNGTDFQVVRIEHQTHKRLRVVGTPVGGGNEERYVYSKSVVIEGTKDDGKCVICGGPHHEWP